jgi:hypothetical protein
VLNSPETGLFYFNTLLNFHDFLDEILQKILIQFWQNIKIKARFLVFLFKKIKFLNFQIQPIDF